MSKFNNGESLETVRIKINETSDKADAVEAQTAQITNNGQIVGNVILTQAEYDALPASKLTDGIEYHIREV